MPSKAEVHCIKRRYSCCPHHIERADFVFVAPEGRPKEKLDVIADKISEQWRIIESLSGVNPSRVNTSRVIIGYRHPKDEPGEQDCDPGYGRHCKTPFINIPWGYFDQENQPLESLSHELVHVFDDVSPVLPKTCEWREGRCDFMRLFALYACGLGDIAEEKATCYRHAAYQDDACCYHDYAGRLLLFFEENGGAISRVEQLAKCVQIVQSFWSSDLATLIPPKKPRGTDL